MKDFLFQKLKSKMPADADPLHIGEGGEGGKTEQLVSKCYICGHEFKSNLHLRNHMKIKSFI